MNRSGTGKNAFRRTPPAPHPGGGAGGNGPQEGVRTRLMLKNDRENQPVVKSVLCPGQSGRPNLPRGFAGGKNVLLSDFSIGGAFRSRKCPFSAISLGNVPAVRGPSGLSRVAGATAAPLP
jgi:hypothetical protein